MKSFAKASCRFFTAAIFAMMIGFLLVEVAAAQTPPAAPDQIWFHSRTKNTLQISWGASETATSYRIYEIRSNFTIPVQVISEVDAATNAADAETVSNLRLTTLDDLRCDSTHTYLVGAVNDHGESNGSDQLTVNTDPCDPLLFPVLLEPTNGITITANDFITLTWENGSIDPVDKYYFEVTGPGGYVTSGFTIETLHRLWKLYPGSYQWKVQAERYSDTSEWSNPFAINVEAYNDPNLPPPTPITPTNGITVTPKQVTLSWSSEVQERRGFYLEVWNGQQVVRSLAMTPTTWSVGDLAPGLYSWRVLVETPTSRSYWSEKAVFEVQQPVTPVPTLIYPISSTTVLSGTDVLLKWEDVAVDAYWLEVEGSGNFLIKKFITTSTNYTLSNLLPGEYLWKVQAEQDAIKSEWSPKWLLIVDVLLDPVVDCYTWESSPNIKVFYETNCSGDGKDLPLGELNLSEIDMVNWVSSISIPAGMSIRIFEEDNWQGRTKCYGQSMWNLGTDHWFQEEEVVGNSIHSVEVFKNNLCFQFNTSLALPLLSK